MRLAEVPRLLWVLAAALFVSSASSFLVLFLTLRRRLHGRALGTGRRPR